MLGLTSEDPELSKHTRNRTGSIHGPADDDGQPQNTYQWKELL